VKKLNIMYLMYCISLVAIFALSSCSTAVMKTSPFYTGKIITGKTSSGQIVRWDDPEAVKIEKVFAYNIKARMDDDRIYVWPIFYKNFLMYSFLWPLAEINDVGWEIRPFVSVDNYNKEYRILSGGWNNKNESHYILPFYAKGNDVFVSLPFSCKKEDNDWIYNYMLLGGYFAADQSSFLAPLYYYDGTGKRFYTPICSFGKDSGYIFPVFFYKYVYHDGDKSRSNKHYYILPPFGEIAYKTEKEKSYCTHARFFPLFFYNYEEVQDSYINPKYNKKHFLFKDHPKDYLLNEKSSQQSLFILPSIYFSENRDKKQKKDVIFPFYFYGYNKHKKSDTEWLTLFPFYFSGYNKSANRKGDKQDKEWIATLPFFSYNRDKKNIVRTYMILAGNSEKEILGKMYKASYIVPFYSYSYNEQQTNYTVNQKYKDNKKAAKKEDYWIKEKTVAKNSFIFPSNFSTEYENKKYRSWVTFPFFFKGYDKTYKSDLEWFNIFPAYFYSRNKENIYKNYGILTGTREKKILSKKYNSSYILPFYNYDYEEKYKWKMNPKYKSKHFSMKTRPKDYYINKNTVSKSTYIFPTVTSTEDEDGEYKDFTIFPFYNKGYNKQKGEESEWYSFFPFYAYEKNKQDVSKNYMILCGTSDKIIAEKPYTSSYFLPFYYYAYQRDIDYYNINPKYKNQNLKYEDRPDDYYLEKESVKKQIYIFPNIFMYENKEKGDSSFTFFPFIFHQRHKTYEKTGSFFSFYQQRKSFTNDDLRIQILWYLYYYKRNDSKITNYIFPSYYSYTNRRKNHTVTNFFPFTFHEKTDSLDSFGTFLWLYTSRNYLKQKKTERQLLWYLYYNQQYAADQENGTEAYESSRVLWKAYHRETKGSVTNIDIFPFISYSKNQKRKKFSFAYRFFSIETGKKSTKIYLLFLPVWW